MSEPRAFISPSKLELYRQYVAGTYSWATQEAVEASIRGDKVYKAAFTLGTAFHATLEHGPERYHDAASGRYVVHVEEYDRLVPVSFSPAQMQWPLRLRSRYPAMAHECEGLWQADHLGLGPVSIRYRLDGVHGLEIHEHKTTSREFQYETYADSYQWRLYLLATEAAACQYNVFCLLRPEEGGDAVVEAHVTRFYPYPELAEDVRQLLRGYLDFAAARNLLSYVYR